MLSSTFSVPFFIFSPGVTPGFSSLEISQGKQAENQRDTDNIMMVSRGKGIGVWQRIKGVRYMVTEDDLILIGGHTMQIYRSCIIEMYA